MSTPSAKAKVIDVDAHVVETERVWDYLEPTEEKYRSTLVTSPENPRQFWMLDGEIQSHRGRQRRSETEDSFRQPKEFLCDLVRRRIRNTAAKIFASNRSGAYSRIAAATEEGT
jgi:hypothetical protein